MSVYTVETDYTGRPGVASSYLVLEGREAAIVETSTALAIPRILSALRAQGLAPADVRYIVITHVHLDHAGGAGALMAACPNATLLAHPRALPHAIDPRKLEASARKVYGDATFDALYGAITPVPADRTRAMGDGEVLRWGRRGPG